eukprot:6192727-Pleurochrysis_carterae.AAC.3
MKTDLLSENTSLWDPAAFRIMFHAHPRVRTPLAAHARSRHQRSRPDRLTPAPAPPPTLPSFLPDMTLCSSFRLPQPVHADSTLVLASHTLHRLRRALT